MRLRKNERGSAAVEYGLLCAGIAAAMIAPLFAMQILLGAIFQQTADSIEGDYQPVPSAPAIPSPPACTVPPAIVC